MQFCALSTVKQRITLGAPLPFNVRDADHTLLLACGQVIDSEAQMFALFERGALVDVEELARGLSEAQDAPAETLPALWDRCLDRVGTVLRASVYVDFIASLATACSHCASPTPAACRISTLRSGCVRIASRCAGVGGVSVASLTNRHGEPMLDPLRRNTALPEHAIVKVVKENDLRLRVSVERLALLAKD